MVEAPNPAYRQQELPKVLWENPLFFVAHFLSARCVVLLLLAVQIGVERVHAAQVPQQVLAEAAGSEPAI